MSNDLHDIAFTFEDHTTIIDAIFQRDGWVAEVATSDGDSVEGRLFLVSDGGILTLVIEPADLDDTSDNIRVPLSRVTAIKYY